MTIPEQRRFAAPTSPQNRSPETIQREHELNRALEAARTLQERLELLGDRAGDVAVVVSLRNSLARDLELNR